MTPHDHYVSKEKYKELEAELKYLTTERRKEIAAELEYAKSLGDLSENAEYQEARDAQAKIEDRIMVIENILKKAVIVEEKHGGVVQLGSKLKVQREGGSVQEIHVVGSEEADVKLGKISNDSPLGQAVLGKKKGDKVAVRTPKGEIAYKIIEVE